MKTNIKDYENYIIYDNGDIYNNTTQKMLKGSIGEHGYKYYRLSKNGKKKMFYAHRLVAEHFLPNPNNLPVVNHIDGNKLNNSVTNLEWVSYSENTKKWHSQNNKERRKFVKYDGDQIGEEWKEIPEYSNYRISNKGRIHNIKTNNILQQVITCGYYKATLCQNGVKKDIMIHKLVYSVFADDFNIKENEVIDHIDGNKLNNDFNNLRKITLSENVRAALYETKTNQNAKRVGQYTLDGQFIKEFPSAREAAKQLGLDASVISKVCRQIRYKSHGGFIFKYL